MADFNSEFWSWFINIIIIGGIVWLVYLLQVNSKRFTIHYWRIMMSIWSWKTSCRINKRKNESIGCISNQKNGINASFLILHGQVCSQVTARLKSMRMRSGTSNRFNSEQKDTDRCFCQCLMLTNGRHLHHGWPNHYKSRRKAGHRFSRVNGERWHWHTLSHHFHNRG